MYNCFDIAEYFVKLAKKEGEGIDPMKLLKLTYIAHGWYLGFKEKPLFNNQIQAWKYGTVIPELYHVIKRFGSGYVDQETLDLYSENVIKEDDKDFLNTIWKHYKDYSGSQLSDKTHEKGTPWETSYNGGRNVPISMSKIKKYYKDLIEEKSRV
ncbi:Panacea domain-containing protein [Aquimarina longa]|uniref:Panacea domain-containing protein n=1 Tax=Aquimarina longa TaxID=1080221 RepID=UPI000780FFF8|nr:type II toxin-antitoxin system antitoxin SocA domain-containing protein [Aquimarina longa]